MEEISLNQILEQIALFLFLYLYQSVIYVFGIHLFSKHQIKWKPFFICAAASMAITYFVRIFLTFGNHTLFSLIFLIILSITLLKIPAQKAVKSALFVAIITFIFEGAIFFVFSAFMGIDPFKKFLETNLGKISIGLLCNVMLTIFLLPIYFFKKRKRIS